MNENFSRAYIEKRIKELSPWYHKIDLGNGIVTPGREYDRIWTNTRAVIDKIDYTGKCVLDIASWDGYWAFEAERRGAKMVVSSDVRLLGFENLLFAKQVLGSKVIPLCNAPVQDLENRVRVAGFDATFDIVHHFGLFYHLRDPLLSFAQARKVMPAGALLVLETAFINDNRNSFMAFAGLHDKYHFYGGSDTWAPTLLCLREVLVRSMFKPVMEDAWQIIEPTQAAKDKFKGKIGGRIGRITMVAEAVAEDTVRPVDYRKIMEE
jgi:SAM-dependent methyltransferase